MTMENNYNYISGKMYFCQCGLAAERAFLETMTHLHCNRPSMPAKGNKAGTETFELFGVNSVYKKEPKNNWAWRLLQPCCTNSFLSMMPGWEHEFNLILTLTEMLQTNVGYHKTIFVWQNLTICGLVVGTFHDHDTKILLCQNFLPSVRCPTTCSLTLARVTSPHGCGGNASCP